MNHDDPQRRAAEHHYAILANDYERAPIGSRDWMIFWQGWQAAMAQSAAPQGCMLHNCRQCGTGVYAPARDAGPTPFGGRSAAGRRSDLI